MKDNAKTIPLSSGIEIPKMKGHVTIEMYDPQTGESEVVAEGDNMITNAIQQYFANCGFMNYPSLDKATLVEQLMGGVMCFDDIISEDADIVHVPAGLNMIANAAQGITTTSDGEQGSAVENTTSPNVTIYNGWQNDGSYLHTYDFLMGQGNGNIACVCLANKNYAWAGEGNSTSHRRHSTKTNITNIAGSAYAHSGTTGYVFNVDLTDSSCQTFAIETRIDQEEQKYITGVLRKYRLPISKLNIKGKPTAPILLSEEEIEIDNDLINATCLSTQPLGTKLLMWNGAMRTSGGSYDGPNLTWGDGFTQYLWEVASDGTITKTTVTNTTGDTLNCLGAAIFDGNYCFFLKTLSYVRSSTYTYYRQYVNSSKIYIWNRTTGTMTPIDNPYGNPYDVTVGEYVNMSMNYKSQNTALGWNLFHGSGDGKIITAGNYPVVVDAVNSTVYPTNADTTTLGEEDPTGSPLIRTTGINLYRDQGYIASIFNLETAVTKNAQRGMRITYRITFNEEEEEES